MRRTRVWSPGWVALAAIALLTTSCSLVGGDDDGGDDSKRVVLVTHESFVISKELQKQFEDESGYDLVVKASGDAGALTNKLVLTKDDPTGDAVFGIDNTFGSRAIDEGVLAPYAARCPTARTSTRCRATTTTTSPRSTPATSASTSTTRGSPTRASRSPRRSTTW